MKRIDGRDDVCRIIEEAKPGTKILVSMVDPETNDVSTVESGEWYASDYVWLAFVLKFQTINMFTDTGE